MEVRLLQLVTRRQRRGAEVFAASLSTALAGIGYKVVFAGLYPAEDGKYLTVPGIKNVDLNGTKGKLHLVLAIRLYRLISQEKINVVQANGSDTLKYALAVRFFFPRLKVVYRNISMVSAWASHPAKRMFYRRIFQQVDAVSSVGKFAAADLMKFYSVEKSKINLIRRGVEPELLDRESCRSRLLQEFGLPSDAFILLHIGHFSTEKNHRFLLDVFEKLAARHPQVYILFVGSGHLFQQTKDYASGLSYAHRIVFAGHRQQVQTICAGANLCLLASLVEGVPGVLLEAAAQAVPSVAVDVGGVSEIVRHQSTGLLVQGHNPDAFVDAIGRLISDPHELMMLGMNAQQMVLKEFSMQQSVKDYQGLFAKLLNE